MPAFTIGITYFSIVSQMGEELSAGLDFIYADSDFSGYVFAVLILLVMFISMYSFISTIAVSKDGHDAYAMKYLPVAFHRQLICKMIPDIAVCLLSYAVVAVMAMILFRVPLIHVLLSIPVAVLYSTLHGFLILSDVRRPKLDWTSEIQIVKKNMRMMFTMAYSLLNMGLVAVLAFILNMDLYVMCAILSVLYLALDVLLYRYIERKDIALADGFE